MDGFKSGRRKNGTGGSIGISIFPSGKCGRGTTDACGPTTNGRNTDSHRSYGLLARITTICSQVITNCVATMKAVSRSLILVCYRSLSVADSEAHHSAAQSKKRGGCRLQSLAFGCIPARLIIPLALANYQTRGMVIYKREAAEN